LSDGFRGDLRRGRVIRVARGCYRIGPMPGGTQRRIAAEVRRLRMAVRTSWRPSSDRRLSQLCEQNQEWHKRW